MTKKSACFVMGPLASLRRINNTSALGSSPCLASGAFSTCLEARRGFTLLEIIIVISLFAIVAGFGLIVSMDDYRGFNFRNERDVVASVLQKARSQAINNMCFERGSISCTDGKSHGAYFGNDGEYVIFQGASYASRDADADEIIDAKDGGTGVSGFTEVVFERLSGESATLPSGTRTLTVTDESGRESVFTVEASGRIWWTN